MHPTKQKQGFIIQIAIIILAFIALSFYFGLDVINFFKKESIQDILQGIWNTLKLMWVYIQAGFNYVVELF